MKKTSKRVCFLITLMLIMSLLLVGCDTSPNEADNTKEAVETQKATEEPTVSDTDETSLAGKYAFPLAEAKTLSVMARLNNNISDFNDLQVVKDLQEKTNVVIDWVPITGADNKVAKEQVNLLFASGDYPEVVLGNRLNDADVSKFASGGVLIPLDDYINEELTPNLLALFTNVPSARGVSTFTDGHIYALPRYNGMASDYLESILFINKSWLDNLNLTVPETTEELYSVLQAFRDGDPNGNGKQDEIPMSFLEGSSFSFPEALLACWGAPTKHGTSDSFITVKNGEVLFSPMLPEFKEMIKYYNRLYDEGLLDLEAFTQSSDQYNAKIQSEESIVGITWYKTNPFKNADEYIAIPPINAPGYDVVWRIHPGALGIKNVFEITDKAEEPELAMAWIDTFYTEEATLINWYGPVGTVFNDENGMLKFGETPEGFATAKEFQQANTISHVNVPGVFYKEELGKIVEYADMWKSAEVNFSLYEPYLDTETWPRPYYDEASTQRISELRTDILNMVNQMKAEWIVGSGVIESEWDEYLENLKKIGIDEYIEINQKAYDAFKTGMGN